MSTARAERLVNLVLCLLSTRQYLTAERIRGIVPGYTVAPSDEAFFRMFERDKAELRDLGIPLETGRNSVFDNVEGYRIARRDYELGEIDLEPDEAAAVALAVRLWESPELTGAAHGALLKLRAAGVEVDQSAPAAVEPKVRTSEPAFGPLLAAVHAGRAVTFGYRRFGASQTEQRIVEPWGVVSWRGRWYVVGHDRNRAATRCFRLSRIVGEVRAIGPEGAVQRPDDVDLLQLIAGDPELPPPAATARLWVAEGRAQGLRRRAKPVESRILPGPDGQRLAGDVMDIDLIYQDPAASLIAGYGPDVVVLEPESLREAVERLLTGVGAHVGSGVGGNG